MFPRLSETDRKTEKESWYEKLVADGCFPPASSFSTLSTGLSLETMSYGEHELWWAAHYLNNMSYGEPLTLSMETMSHSELLTIDHKLWWASHSLETMSSGESLTNWRPWAMESPSLFEEHELWWATHSLDTMSYGEHLTLWWAPHYLMTLSHGDWWAPHYLMTISYGDHELWWTRYSDTRSKTSRHAVGPGPSSRVGRSGKLQSDPRADYSL